MVKRNECPNCQFSLVDAATGTCKVCDFIQAKQRSRPCSSCSKTNCHYFCDTCGTGYHRRCAEKNKVRVTPLDDDNEVSVVCPSCEKDDSGAEVKCGGCRKEFSNEEAGLQVGQLVLVEFDMVLYNAVVIEVNEVETSVKIHFVKWSKSFDGWYKMDDERVNESLACDGCNRWFHIDCLPEVKSTGRYKAASYVCESCFKEAKAHRTNGKASKSNMTSVDHPKPTKDATSRTRSSRKVISEDESNCDDEDENGDVDDESAIVLSPSALVQLPDLPKRKVGRPSHKQLEAERQALAKRKALLKTLKEPSSPLATPATAETDKKDKKDEQVPISSTVVELAPSSTIGKIAKSPRLRGAATSKTAPTPPPPAMLLEKPTASTPQTRLPSSPKRKAMADRSTTRPTTTTSSPSKRTSTANSSRKSKPSSKPKRTPIAAPAKSPSPIATDDDSDGSNDCSDHSISSGESDQDELTEVQQKASRQDKQPPNKKLKVVKDEPRQPEATSTAPLIPPAAQASPSTHQPVPPTTSALEASRQTHVNHNAYLPRMSVGRKAALPCASSSIGNSKLILLSTLLNSPRYDRANQENYPPLFHLQGRNRLDILQDVANQSITSTVPPPPSSPPPPLPPGPGPPVCVAPVTASSETGLEHDMHFYLREEMYRLVCELEEGGKMPRDTATLLRAWTHPSAPRFQDMRFVYLVNKHMSRDHLAHRLGELTRKQTAQVPHHHPQQHQPPPPLPQQQHHPPPLPPQTHHQLQPPPPPPTPHNHFQPKQLNCLANHPVGATPTAPLDSYSVV
ncbi:hypothetical protein H310_08168 [Aphanomyces invadans]|uniref:PHD-type domain-containing protein n=1 Tax=Aphanomyces invadans TaxID=157072 RepID=A0A024TZR7_9STRA|nr:hypothetical protein H310_08168 [Aphanomyces invadans]ETV99493.1 hypothetical protein H310_08168 [Aphanomyces invadans]|eukprot:XP_008872049.1 hypothetical protein H310_08168 [Aphanomyces invadans]